MNYCAIIFPGSSRKLLSPKLGLLKKGAFDCDEISIEQSIEEQ